MASRICAGIVMAFAAALGVNWVSAQTADDKAIVAMAATAKFGPAANAPDCFTISVERGDPSKGASVILAKFAPHCVAPFHWHTPSETVMIVNGALEVQMKGEKAAISHAGDFVYMPPKHVHRATCTGAVPCTVFLTSDAAFDIHWVDADGKEISLADAMKAAKGGKAASGAAKK
jgi:quercetin dioxygenase-like cupin family protein